ncbi:MAG: cupin domain-containing protein [Limnohabitans sp.]
MSTKPITLVSEKAASPKDYFLASERLVAGNPQLRLWENYADATGNFFVGIWQGDIGTWRIAYKKDEYCEILEGRSVLTDAAGHSTTVVKGDRFVIPRGFTGTWQVLECTKKIYASYEPRGH